MELFLHAWHCAQHLTGSPWQRPSEVGVLPLFYNLKTKPGVVKAEMRCIHTGLGTQGYGSKTSSAAY